MLTLTLIALSGLYAYCQQFVHGLVTTGMTDQVSWGLYIANFTYLVGLAAAAAMLVIPVYVYGNLHLHDVVIFGELLAVAVVIMCLMFVTVDLGRPDRFLHLLQRFNFPLSITKRAERPDAASYFVRWFSPCETFLIDGPVFTR